MSKNKTNKILTAYLRTMRVYKHKNVSMTFWWSELPVKLRINICSKVQQECD